MKRQVKPYWEMTTAELREATREFDREELGLPGKPLTAHDRKLHAQARRRAKMNAKNIRVSLEGDLVKQADAVARKLHLTRSEVIANSLRVTLKRAG